MSCSGDFLAKSTQKIDRDQLSRGERWQCRTDVLVTDWWRSCIGHVRSTLQGGPLPGTEQVTRMLMRSEEEGSGHEGTDGRGLQESNQVKQDVLPIVRQRVLDRS